MTYMHDVIRQILNLFYEHNTKISILSGQKAFANIIKAYLF